MIVLAIDTSFDDTAAAIVDDKRVLSSVANAQFEEHQAFGGVVPEVASRLHVERILPCIDQCLADAGIGLDRVEALAVSNRPGLLGSLLVGLDATKGLAYALDKPFVAVHHIEAHVYALFLERQDLPLPLVCLVASGGHTSLIALEDHGVMRVLGRTRDDAAGEAFDKVARAAGLGLPGGPALSKLAESGDPRAVPMPRPLVGELEFSFSGVKSHAARLLGAGEKPADVAAAFEAAVVDVLTLRLMDGARHAGAECVGLGGGVAANGRLREQVTAAAAKAGFEVVIPSRELCTDNAAMVGCIGHAMLAAGIRAGLETDAQSTAAVGERSFGRREGS